MPDISIFESRTGNLTCTPGEIFDFVTDIRNFRQFVPAGTIEDLKVEAESCSFRVSPVGDVRFSLSQRETNRKVVYEGNVLHSNDFSLVLDIRENTSGKAVVNLKLEAHLNPLLKMMAAKPIERFLEKMIDEMENFSGWQSAAHKNLH
jgi:carbon monoxide dehydrogenase subunit G